MKIKVISTAAATVLLMGATSASALGVTIGGTPIGSTALPSGATDVTDTEFDDNDFIPMSPIDAFYDAATLTLNLGSAPGARITFTEVFAESGGASTFNHLPTSQSMTEPPINGPGETFFIDLFSGGGFESDLTFTSTLDLGACTDASFTDNDFCGGTPGFGVFFEDSKNVGDGVTEFWLALDDGGASEDDNHDDYIIKASVAAVPLPAAAWLLLGAAGGLIAAKRRQSHKAA